jgi:hypothetical protein
MGFDLRRALTGSKSGSGTKTILSASERRRREQQAAATRARVADMATTARADELRKKKNPGRRDRFGRRMTDAGETILGGRAGLDEMTTARFGATPTGGKTILGV